MPFQVEHLSTLIALVDEGTFEAASTRLHITASAVSQRVKAMEQSAGQVLVQRTTPVVTTAAGEVVLRYARQVQLLGADTAESLGRASGAGSPNVDPGAKPEHVSIAIAVNADSLATWFLPALAALPQPTGTVFDLKRDDQEHTTQLLRSGEVMAAVTSTAEAVQGCSTEPLGTMRYLAVASPGFVAEWLNADPRLLSSSPMVNFDRKDDLQHRFLRTLTGSTARPPCHYVPTSADFARAIVLGLGWGLLPELQCGAALADGSLVELAPGHPVDVNLFWQRWNLSSAHLNRVTEVVREGAQKALRAA
ncbi:LysR family transcriptional regulator ArgP [Subtercola vilae]|uniref:LysR family transcriptional regulator ArgP n=2 Tax=Subtercola vilae TaxID=2056433 RepID=A0A4T2BZM7_9MICO|nr:LysR family transcriptional regulator ArgP [Subtercola vilae]TIH35316.1 LysR family transcriptional regulator ArgP [Subtercola vilae]